MGESIAIDYKINDLNFRVINTDSHPAILIELSIGNSKIPLKTIASKIATGITSFINQSNI